MRRCICTERPHYGFAYEPRSFSSRHGRRRACPTAGLSGKPDKPADIRSPDTGSITSGALVIHQPIIVFHTVIADKKDISILRVAATLWLKENEDHHDAESVKRALRSTNIPATPGRPKITGALAKRVIDAKRKGMSDAAVSRKLGISAPTISRIYAEYEIAQSILRKKRKT